MKKFLAILLAMMLVMVSVAALADDPQPADSGSSQASEATPTPADPVPQASYKPGDGSDDGTDTQGTPRVNATLKNGGTITLDKVFSYTVGTDVTANAKLPVSDNIIFTATLDSIANSTVEVDDMADKNVTVTYNKPTAEVAVSTSPQKHGTITVQFPTYPEVGIYTYTIHESGKTTTEGTTTTTTETAGIGFSADITLKVTVIRQDNELRIAGVAFRLADSGKLGEVTNTYKAGDLEVKKTVSGNMGDQKRKFPITVTFTAPANKTVDGTISYTGPGASDSGTIAATAWEKADGATSYSYSKQIELAHNESVTFTNIPDGVTYTIVEDAYDGTSKKGTKHAASADADQDLDYAYYVTGEKTDTAIAAGIKTTETINNAKEVTVDTGITLETLPYVLMMALAMMGLVALKLRKREEY